MKSIVLPALALAVAHAFAVQPVPANIEIRFARAGVEAMKLQH